MNKNLENYRDLYYALDFRFSIICSSKTWSDNSFVKNSPYQMRNYNGMHQPWNGRKGGRFHIFNLESLCCNIRKDLYTNNYDIETLAL